MLPTRHAANSACCQLGMLPTRHAANSACCQLGMLPTRHAANSACCQLGMLPTRHAANSACCQLGMLPTRHAANSACCQLGMLPTGILPPGRSDLRVARVAVGAVVGRRRLCGRECRCIAAVAERDCEGAPMAARIQVGKVTLGGADIE